MYKSSSDPSDPRPNWLNDITFETSDAPFEVLKDAAHYRDYPNQWIDLESLGLTEPLDDYLKRDTNPLPILEDREDYFDSERHFDWWLSGLDDYLCMERVLADQGGLALGEGTKLLELGCASGRVLRHAFCQGGGTEVWGCDIKLRHIEWMRNFLPQPIKVFQNTILPHLPLEGNYFDAVAAYSVFTHIDHLELAWIAELRRILKPGGIAVLSIHGDAYWTALKPGKAVYDLIFNLQENLVGWDDLSPEVFEKPMPRDKTVFTWSTARNYNCNVFHSTNYIHSAWGRFFEVLKIIPAGHGGEQDLVVLRKPGN